MAGSCYEIQCKAFLVTHILSGFHILRDLSKLYALISHLYHTLVIFLLTSINELSLSKQMITASAGLAGAVFGLIAEHAGLCFTIDQSI